MKLSGKKVVLTGATGGIGQAIAKALDSEGCSLLLTGRNTDKLHQLMASLKDGDHSILIADLTTKDGVDALGEAAQRFGTNVLINSLGVNQLSALGDMNGSDIVSLITTNLIVPIDVCRRLLPLLESQPQAIIVNIGSIMGSIGFAGSTSYCASKFGLRGFTESLRRELADSNIRVIYFAPRATDTELNSDEMSALTLALGNAIDRPEWVARQLVKALVSDNAKNCYLGWPEHFFVRLNGLLPSIVDIALSKQLATIKRYCRSGQAK